MRARRPRPAPADSCARTRSGSRTRTGTRTPRARRARARERVTTGGISTGMRTVHHGDRRDRRERVRHVRGGSPHLVQQLERAAATPRGNATPPRTTGRSSSAREEALARRWRRSLAACRRSCRSGSPGTARPVIGLRKRVSLTAERHRLRRAPAAPAPRRRPARDHLAGGLAHAQLGAEVADHVHPPQLRVQPPAAAP